MSDNDAQPYNSGHQIEGLDRCHTVLEMIHFLLDEHPAVLKAGAMPLIEQARTAIFQAYQQIGELDDAFEPDPEGDTRLGLGMTLLDWNRQQAEPPIRVGYEYGVADAVLAIQAGKNKSRDVT